MSVSLSILFLLNIIVQSEQVGRDSKCDKGVWFIDRTHTPQDKTACIGFNKDNTGNNGINARLDAILSANPGIQWRIDSSGDQTELHVKPNDKIWLHWNRAGFGIGEQIVAGCYPTYYCRKGIFPWSAGYPTKQQLGDFSRSTCGIGGAFVRAVCDGGHWKQINFFGWKGGWTVECKSGVGKECNYRDEDGLAAAEVRAASGPTTHSPPDTFLVLVGMGFTILLILGLAYYCYYRTKSTEEYSLLEDEI